MSENALTEHLLALTMESMIKVNALEELIVDSENRAEYNSILNKSFDKITQGLISKFGIATTEHLNEVSEAMRSRLIHD